MNAVATIKEQTIQPFKIDRAMVALKIMDTDDTLLSYLRFLSNRMPIAAFQFIHILQKNLQTSYFEAETRQIIGKFDLKEEVAASLRVRVENILPIQKDRAMEYLVKEGYPLEELIYRSKLNGADLVVIGQDMELIHHHILARNFLRKVRTNALVVPNTTLPRLDNILVPIDFSSYSINALQTAVAINKSLAKPIKITCINVFEVPNLTFYKVKETRQDLKQLIEKDRKLAMTHFLQEQVPTIQDRKYIKTALVEKEHFDIGYQVNEFAKANKTDMVIMGVKGHSKAELLMMGSVTERVLGINRVPTLIVK